MKSDLNAKFGDMMCILARIITVWNTRTAVAATLECALRPQNINEY